MVVHCRRVRSQNIFLLLAMIPVFLGFSVSVATASAMPGDHQARPFTLLDHICSPSVLEELIKSAEEGHEGAQYYVGAMLFDGMCGEMDEAEGLIWILQAAERGLIDAQHDYGRLSLESATTQEQRYRALYWLGAAAGQGDALSALTLARMHEAGLHGLDQNICLALDWYAAGEALGNDDLIDHAQSLRATSPDC